MKNFDDIILRYEVEFLTDLDEQASHLAIILFLSKEKQTNSGGVSLGLSLDFLIYNKVK